MPPARWFPFNFLSGGIYHRTKLMNVLFTRELARRWSHLGVASCWLQVKEGPYAAVEGALKAPLGGLPTLTEAVGKRNGLKACIVICPSPPHCKPWPELSAAGEENS